mmetsp:Transcript_43763/g.118069  ORF Transcript_43763/g.118069 Transcript_43763/m.118069 type:complete len:384 (-) Transcript_43763:253-1404(-)
MSSTVPYIGSKISLVSNSDIRYEGILYTINTQESTIALQSVRCCGTEGRKMPEIPPSSEIYDFIIFRGQDIKDLTVLESANPALSAQLNDPAIMSVNQRPPGSVGGKGGKSGSSSTPGGYASGGGYGGGKGCGGSSSSYGAGYGGGGKGGWGGTWQKPDSRTGGPAGGKPKGADGGKGGWKGVPKGGKDKGGKGGEKGGKDKGGKGYEKGAGKDKGGGKGGEKGGGKAMSGKGGKGGGGQGGGPGGRRSGGSGGGVGDGAGGTPVGELLPQVNEAEKSKYTEEFDYEGENKKFDKVLKDVEGDEAVDEKLKPLSGYDKGKSFFDNISCEATERAGDAERPKVDRNKARQNDRETFGDTRRPPRPTGGRRGKGGRRGAPRGYRN